MKGEVSLDSMPGSLGMTQNGAPEVNFLTEGRSLAREPVNPDVNTKKNNQ